MKRILWRTLVVLHRYLGIAVGLLMLVWFTSGIVMMYVEYPEANEAARLRALAPIPWQACCQFKLGLIPDEAQFYRVQVENLLGIPVMRLRRPPRPDMIVDLAEGVGVVAGTGRTVFTLGDARAIALDTATRSMGTVHVLAAETIDRDQWTLGGYGSNRPFHRITLDDPQGSVFYVSGTNGQIVLRTTATERMWNWLGAIPHWLYFTALRSDGPLWSATIIWTSLIGTFLTVLGLYLGIAQFRRGKDGKLSPYRGLFCWHHLAGLVFGIFTLTFVASGLISMNPWGFLEGSGGGGAELRRLEGPTPKWGEVKASLAALPERAIAAVSLMTAPFDGKLYWLATAADGTVTRLDAAGHAAPLHVSELGEAAERMLGAGGIAAQELLNEEDAYYLRHGEPRALPVYRVIANDADNTRYYLDPVSGALRSRTDATARWHRWLFDGFHHLDFAGWLRVRPLWDIIMIVLLLGGGAASATGVYLAVRRIRSDFVTLFRMAASLRRWRSKAGLSDGPSPA